MLSSFDASGFLAFIWAISWRGLHWSPHFPSRRTEKGAQPMKSLRFISLRMGIVFCLLTPAATATFSQMSPVPFIDILSPTSTYPGHGGFTLTISGANFATGATVQFDGLTLTPSAVTRNSLTVTIPAAAVASAHTASVSVKNPNSNPSNLIRSNVAFFPIAKQTAGLQWTAPFSVLDPPPPFGPNVGPPATAFAVGDFNEDGHQDVVVALPGILKLYTGDGKGSFTAAGSVSTAGLGAIQALETGDFNNDGHLDVAVTDDGTLAVFFNDGTGTFTAGPTTALPLDNDCLGEAVSSLPSGLTGPPYRFGVADIDGDGALDVVLPANVTSSVIVLLGDGLGHFKQSSAVALGASPYPCYIALGDFNNDGWVDAVDSSA